MNSGKCLGAPAGVVAVTAARTFAAFGNDDSPDRDAGTVLRDNGQQMMDDGQTMMDDSKQMSDAGERMRDSGQAMVDAGQTMVDRGEALGDTEMTEQGKIGRAHV